MNVEPQVKEPKMSFDAGAITGSLKLNTSEFSHGILDAQTKAAIFPEIVIHFLEEPILAFGEVVKKTFETVFEWVGHTAEGFHTMGLAALRTGTDVEWLSRLAANAKTAGVGLDSLVAGFKILEQRAELALEGNEAAINGFKRLGVGMDELKGLMESPQALFARVQESIEGMGNAAQRNAAALGVLGRGGFNLAPILTRSAEESKKLADTIQKLGGITTQEQVKMGEKWTEMGVIFDAAWEGIKRAVAEPILKVLGDNMDEIVAQVQNIQGVIRGFLQAHSKDIEAFIKGAIAAAKEFIDVTLPNMVNEIKQVTESIVGMADALKDVSDLLGIVRDVGDFVGQSVGVTTFERSERLTGPSSASLPKTTVNMNMEAPVIDVNAASSQAAAQFKPLIEKADKKAKEHVEREIHKLHTAHGLR